MKRKIANVPLFHNQIFQGDCVSLAKKYLPNDSVDLIVTDPPYGIAGQTLDKHYNRNEGNVVDGYIDVNSEDYGKFSNDWIKEAARVLRSGRRMFIVSGWSHLAEVLSAINLSGLNVVNHIIWKYNFGVYTTKKFVSSHYHILLVQKGVFDKEISKWTVPESVSAFGDVWRIKREYKPGQVKNKNQLPSVLLQRMINMSSVSGDVVADFFAGSGSTAVESVMIGRIACGFELNPDAFAFASENLRQSLGTNRQKTIDSIFALLPKSSDTIVESKDCPAPSPIVNSNNSAAITRNISVELVDLVISQIPLLSTSSEEKKCVKNIQRASDIIRSGGSIFLIVSAKDVLFVLRCLNSINSLAEINHAIWSWTPSKNARKRASDENKLADSHLHVLFFAKEGGERTFNRFCRFSESAKTATGGSACYADMEDVWSFDETFDESFPVASDSVIQKIVLYCSNVNDVVADVFSSTSSSSPIYKSIGMMKKARQCLLIN